MLRGASDEIDQAHLSVRRLDSVAVLLPDLALFPWSYVRKEAVVLS